MKDRERLFVLSGMTVCAVFAVITVFIGTKMLNGINSKSLMASVIPSATNTVVWSGSVVPGYNNSCSNSSLGFSTSTIMTKYSDGVVTGTLTFDYICSSCTDRTKKTPIWLLVKTTRVDYANLCGINTESYREVYDSPSWTDPYGQCRVIKSNTTRTFKSEIPQEKVFCPAPTPIPKISVATSSATTTLACRVLTRTMSNDWETGYNWDSKSIPPWGVPPGGQNEYSAMKIIKENLSQSSICPNPFRKSATTTCELMGDVDHFGIKCPKPTIPPEPITATTSVPTPTPTNKPIPSVVD
ncbi:MAG: hypothetical protein WCP15_00010 [bacterium]